MESERLIPLALATDPALAGFFLGRLASLLARQAMASPPERAVLAAAAFSVFLDCLDLGLEAEAQRLVDSLRGEDEMLVA